MVAIAKLVASQPQTVVLTEKTTVLPAIVVRGQKTKIRRLGTTTHNPFLWGNIIAKNTHDIVEFAKRIPLNGIPAQLLQAHVFLRRPTVDTIALRLNFYRETHDLPAERLVEQVILVRTASLNG